MEQKLKDLLAEQGIALEPATPPGKTVSTLIQRGWNLLFGRKGTYLYPVHVERLGGLMVMPFEGLIQPDYKNNCLLDSTDTSYVWNFASVAPRISEIRTAMSLTASPYTLAGGAYMLVSDGDVGDTSMPKAYVPGGCQALWVFTERQYLSVALTTAVAVEMRVALRSWEL